MATRRVRIKGIANIPQRRKVEPKNDEIISDHVKPSIEDDEKLCDLNKSNEKIEKGCLDIENEVSSKIDDVLQSKEGQFSNTHDSVDKVNDTEIKSTENSDVSKEKSPTSCIDHLTNCEIPKESEQVNHNSSVKPSTAVSLEALVNEENIEIKILNFVENAVSNFEQKIQSDCNNLTDISRTICQNGIENKEDTIKKPLVNPGGIRRSFIKPVVNANLLNRRVKPKIEEHDSDASKKKLEIISNVTIQSPIFNSQDDFVSVPPSPINVFRAESAKSGSDSEYSAPPASPSKSFSRIKAVPRLSHRRISFSIPGSASESEDDTRRNFKRIRNDSLGSCTSTINEGSISVDQNIIPKKEFSSVIQRKCRRSEQSRKMAEARREFLLKFHNNTPNRQKLTMMDLIFYNPTNNPMSQIPKRKQDKPEPEELDIKVDEEKEDDPLSGSEEDSLPAPQIKIGIDGEIVVDEKSLIIENQKVKKEREMIEKSTLIDGDNETTYGLYKRPKRSKDWSQSETLRFYKALNTIGTDFMLISELFPGRNRREIKMKFKKEERVNRALVDKALTKPTPFDLTDLKREMEIERKIQKERERRKQEKKETKHKTLQKRVLGKGLLARETDVANEKKDKLPIKANIDDYTRLQKGFSGILDDDDDDDDNENSCPASEDHPSPKPNESDEKDSENSDDEIYSIPPITRSGRIPKPRLVVDIPVPERKRKYREPKEFETRPKVSKQNTPENIVKDENGDQQLTPGSIMIVPEEKPNGEAFYNIYMITPNENNETDKVTESADLLNVKGNFTVQNILSISAEQQITECNFTIVHDEKTGAPVAIDSVESTVPFSSNVLSETLPVINDKDTSSPNLENAVMYVDDRYNVKLDKNDGVLLPVVNN